MWSLGVLAYILLTGSPPIHGADDADVMRKIRAGEVEWSARFRRLSEDAQGFVKALLVVDPAQRLTAQGALSHPWIRAGQAAEAAAIDQDTLESLRSFARASQFRRSVLCTMARSLPDGDREEVRRQFLSIDTNRHGTISLAEFAEVLARGSEVGRVEAEAIFRSLDIDGNDEVEYSEFLAGALSGDPQVDECALRETFKRFDADGDGKVDAELLRCALGDNLSQEEVEEVLREAGDSGDDCLGFEEFLARFREPEPSWCYRPRRRVGAGARCWAARLTPGLMCHRRSRRRQSALAT